MALDAQLYLLGHLRRSIDGLVGKILACSRLSVAVSFEDWRSQHLDDLLHIHSGSQFCATPLFAIVCEAALRATMLETLLLIS